MALSSQAKLLTTRTRTAVAIALTGCVFAQALRGAFTQTGHGRGRLLLDYFFGLNGWSLLALNVAFYAYLCWLAFCFIHGTAGTERVFMVGWFTGILLWPVKALRPEWWVAEHFISSIALGMALVAAFSLFGNHREVDSSGTTAVQ